MILTVYVEDRQDEGEDFHYREIDFNLANIEHIDWYFKNGVVQGAAIDYASKQHGLLTPIVAQKLYPKVRAYQQSQRLTGIDPEV